MTRKLDLAVIDVVRGSDYPPPFDAPCRDRERKRLGDAAGLSQFGVNLLRLPPGTWSSQRHWQTASDEFVYVVSGEVVLITDAGEETLRAGDAAGFKAGTPTGITYRTAARRKHWSSRSARGFPATVATTRTST